jgi:hypothetical protein
MLMRSPDRWIRPKRLKPPGFIVPCQPTLADKVPGGGWMHEFACGRGTGGIGQGT